MDHEQLIEAAKVAISAVFSDRSVSQRTTRESLRELEEEITIMLDTLNTKDE